MEQVIAVLVSEEGIRLLHPFFYPSNVDHELLLQRTPKSSLHTHSTSFPSYKILSLTISSF